MSRAIILSLIVFSLLAPNVLMAGEAEVKRFKEDYPAAAAKLNDAYERIKGSYKLSSEDLRDLPENVGETVWKVKFSVDATNLKCEERRHDINGGQEGLIEYIACVNEEKGFIATKTVESDHYVLRELVAAEAGRVMFADSYFKYVKAPFYVYGATLAETMSDPTFELLSATILEYHGQNCMQIEYRFGAPPKSNMTLILEPEQNWVIRHGELRLGFAPKTVVTFDVSYKKSPEGIPLPEAVSYNVPHVTRDRCEFDSIQFEETTPSEFTLNHYGITDIKVAASSNGRTRFTYLCIAIGIVGLIGSSALYKLSHRLEVQPT